MTSIKRLLNDIDDDDPVPGLTQGSSRNSSFEDFSDETPVLQDQTWPDLSRELLGFEYDQNALYDEDAAVDFDSFDIFYSAQDNIADWALENISNGLEFNESVNLSAPLEIPPPVELEVCFGMIYRAGVRLAPDMTRISNKLASGGLKMLSANCVFSIHRGATHLTLRWPDGSEFGQLDSSTSKTIDGIFDLPHIDFDALVDVVTLRQTIERATKASEATLRANINVYGPVEQRDVVGQGLAAGKIYLQHPDLQRPASTYDNPHVLKFAGFEPEKSGSAVVQEEELERRDKAENFQLAVADVYGSLKRGTNLQRLQGDARLKTDLLPHQERALDFLVQREAGPVDPEFCLWKPSDEGGQSYYRHAITNAISQDPPSETGGGVLADEMGMGKTFSILALLAKTTNDAEKWGSDEEQLSLLGIPESRTPSRGTLVIVSSALLLNNWDSEIREHLDGTLKVKIYHGQKRDTCTTTIADADIVLTTYHTLAVEHGANRSLLHEIAWFRVVLDEAHTIRRRSTIFYRTVSELSACYRWCLTGTPIQNRLEDIGALLAFIRARPFDSIGMFRRFVAIPFDEGGEHRQMAIQRLSLLLDSVCLRRTKDLLELPPQNDIVRSLQFSPEELRQYEQTKSTMARAIRQRAGTFDRKNIFGMFQAQLQLRIFCNHGTWQDPFSWTTGRDRLIERESALGIWGQNGEVTCSSCRQSLPVLHTNRVYRQYNENCAHVICLECLEVTVSDEGGQPTNLSECPLCYPAGSGFGMFGRNHLSKYNHMEHKEYFRSRGYSTKMAALIADVQQDLWTAKSVIFSCWTKTLDLIGKYLRENRIPFARIDGDCPLPERQRILDDYGRSPRIPVLMMTTGTGAFGLNLTAASRVFIVEPQWNPSVENQAIARAMRLGQAKSIVVTRYVMERSVEQEMRTQQDRKLKIAELV